MHAHITMQLVIIYNKHIVWCVKQADQYITRHIIIVKTKQLLLCNKADSMPFTVLHCILIDSFCCLSQILISIISLL